VDSSALGPGMDFMEKPYRPDELIARINTMLAAG
jgi:DNA-binding response OmpR family regulator